MRLDRLGPVAWCLFAVTLTGCASLRYTPVPVDSAPPAAAHPPCPAGLAKGASCTALVQAARWQTRTGVNVQPGEHYCVQVPPGQVWFDKDRRNTPPHGERGSALMRMFSGLKRHPDMAWFALVAAVQAPGDAAPASHQDVGRQPGIQVVGGGELVFYPNDAVGQADDPTWFYRNNQGQIWVTVQRCDGACACAAAPPTH